jgi:hypothetical protein
VRTFGSALMVIVALLLAAVAGPALWAERNLVSEDGFVALAAPLGSDAQFQQGLSTLVASRAASKVQLPPQLQALAAGAISQAAKSLQSDPGYPKAWEETLRRSHALAFAGRSATADGTTGLTLDVTPLVDLVAHRVGASIGITLPAPASVLVAVDQPTLARAVPLLATLAGAGSWLAVIAAVVLVLALLVARRRAVALILAGAGLGCVALAWLAGSGFVAGKFADFGAGSNGTANALVGDFGRQLGSLAQGSWQQGITAGFVLAAVLAAAGVLGLMVGRRRTT